MSEMLASVPSPEKSGVPPQFIVFEGVDGVGKSTLAKALHFHFEGVLNLGGVISAAFPGKIAGTLGEWVYRLHHSKIQELKPDAMVPAARQLLHVAAHIDGIQSWIRPGIERGFVILDRFWWSTYAYSRLEMDSKLAWAIVTVERPFWEPLPRPTIVYLARTTSLKGGELNTFDHHRLEEYYREVIEHERNMGVNIIELSNDHDLESCWTALLLELGLTPAPMPRTDKS